MARYDLAYKNGALDISTGDLRIVPSDEQHIQDTIVAHPGWWKQFPSEGFGLSSWLGGPALTQEIQKGIRLNLSADGYSCNPSVSEVNGKLLINPKATY
jgi:hypothetical protein